VLFSLACRKVSTLCKYFVLSHLHLSGSGAKDCGSEACGNLVESLAVRPSRERDRIPDRTRNGARLAA
jgi:hypothetical protein